MKKVTAGTRRCPPANGFTLIELAIATTIGAMLLVAVAEVVQLFGQDVELVSEDQHWRLDECLARLTEQAHHAWTVEEPEPDLLLLADAMGHETRYALDRGARTLTVRRHNGSIGAVLTDVDDFTIDTQEITRYRESRTLDSPGVWWEQPAQADTLEAMPLEAGLRVALGFTLSTHAPDWVHTVDGVTEQTLGATLEHILIPLAFAPPVAEPVSDNDDGDKVQVCHIPPGNPTSSRNMMVAQEALSAHLAHGDVEGRCSSSPREIPQAAGSVLFVDLHEANAPDDARPYGPRLGSISIPVSALPSGRWTWTTKGECEATTFGSGASSSTLALCHIPPGDPDSAHTMHVSSNAVATHLAHGDVIGSCDDGSDDASTRVLVYEPPTTGMKLDLSRFNALIEPGRAHTLVFRLAGTGTVLMAGHPVGSKHHTGVAAAFSPGGSFGPLDLSVPFSLDGLRSYSQTTAHDVVSNVTVELRMLDGKTRSATAAVVSQTAVDNPWLGCVPGEYPGLELAGP